MHRVAAHAAGGAWSPLDLASLTAWWDFSDVTTLFTDAGTTPVSADAQAIYQANDKGPNDLHVAQATAGARPTYKTGIQNSLSVARFDGGDSLAKASVDALGLVAAAAGTLVFVMKQTGAAANNTSITIGASGNRLNVHATYSNVFYLDFGNNGSGGRIFGNQPAGWDDAWHILVCHRAAGAGKIYVDGGSAVVSGTFTDSLDALTETLYIGTGSGATFTGDKAEVLIFDEGLSAANLNALGGYLADKWGLSWSTVT